jgi:hypothetical protein
MIDPRRLAALVAIVATMALLVGACGGGSGSPGASDSGDASQEPAASDGGGPDPSVSIGEGTLPDGFDQRLVPPDSTVGLTISAGEEGFLTSFTSTKSIAELKDFYKNAIESMGGQEVFDMSAGDLVMIAWGSDESGGGGGLVNIVPNTEGAGSIVSVTYGAPS